MSDAENLINDAQTALASPPPVDPADYKEYLNDVIAYGQTVEAGGLPDANLTLALIIHTGSWLPLTARPAVYVAGILLSGHRGFPAGGPLPRGSTGPG